MFKSWSKTRDIITLFHQPSSKASVRVLNLLKQSSAMASETATEDQASDHTAQNKIQRTGFDLDITESIPTPDQMRSILEYLGSSNAGKVVKGAISEGDAIAKLKESKSNFLGPLVVDWNNGKAVVGENESEILKLMNTTTFKED